MRTVRFLDYFGYLLDSTNEKEIINLRDQFSAIVKRITEVTNDLECEDNWQKQELARLN